MIKIVAKDGDPMLTQAHSAVSLSSWAARSAFARAFVERKPSNMRVAKRLLELALCSAAHGCSAAGPARSAEQSSSAPPAVVAPHAQQKGRPARVAPNHDEGVLRIRYIPIGLQTYDPVTSRDIDEIGNDCVINAPEDAGEVMKILASARPPTQPDDVFSDLTVRVKVFGNGDAGEHVIALVENEGGLRRGGVDEALSATAMNNLKRLIETRCKWRRP